MGYECFPDCVAALEAAARAPHEEHLSVSALHLLQAVARRLAASTAEVYTPPKATGSIIDSLALGLGIATMAFSAIMDKALALTARASAKGHVKGPAGYSPL